MKSVEPILDGKYLQSETRNHPPKELGQALGMTMPDSLVEPQKEEV